MAAAAWVVYNRAKRHIGRAELNLSSTVFRMSLYTSAANATGAALSTISSISGEVAEGNGYSSSGKALTNEVFVTGASAGQFKFDFDDVVWTASAGTIPNIKYAVVWLSGASAGGRRLLCRSTLTTSQFTLGTGNTLTIQIAATGAITLA
jgi:hypothetical protein